MGDLMIRGWFLYAFPRVTKFKQYFTGDLADFLRASYYLTIRLNKENYDSFIRGETSMIEISCRLIFISDSIVKRNPEVSRAIILGEYSFDQLLKWKYELQENLYEIIDTTVKIENLESESRCEIIKITNDSTYISGSKKTEFYSMIQLVKRPEVDLLDAFISKFKYGIFTTHPSDSKVRIFTEDFVYLKDIKKRFRTFKDVEEEVIKM